MLPLESLYPQGGGGLFLASPFPPGGQSPWEVAVGVKDTELAHRLSTEGKASQSGAAWKAQGRQDGEPPHVPTAASCPPEAATSPPAPAWPPPMRPPDGGRPRTRFLRPLRMGG